MLFSVGIEYPKSEGENFGIIVPAFERIGYGCVSSASSADSIVTNAKDAILTMAEEVVTDGYLISAIKTDFEEFDDLQSQYQDYDKWLILDVPVESIKSKQKRLNITLPEFLANRIDNLVESNSNYNDRSDFLAKVSSEKLASLHNPNCIDFVKIELPSIVGRGYLDDLASFVCHFFTEGDEELEVNLYRFLMHADEGEKLALAMIQQAVELEGNAVLEPAYRAIEKATEEHAKNEEQEELWKQSSERIAEIDKLEDQYGFYQDKEARAIMPYHIKQRLEELHAEQSAFEVEYG